ncbi:MAG: efflux RND transporter periplasmic adaptor subunit [Bacteroidetes bacterium]|nr:MAG: efflux RND transporter periplasmic adaptor subunit [Bacteroidota bacterium]
MKNITILSLFLCLFFTNCGEKEKKAKENSNEIIAVKVGNIESQIIDKTILASGIVGSKSDARLAFKTGGVIDKILVEEGQNIVKGQLLATLNLTEISAQVTQAKEGFAKAERDLNRVKNLYADSVATLEQLQNATTAYNIAKQNTSIAGFNQSYSEIRASLTGKVLKKIMNEGEIVASGMPVFFIAATTAQDWVIKVGLADKDWARLKIGDKATIALDAYPEKEIEGIITDLAENADMMTGTFECEIKIIPQDIKLAAGLLASVEIKPTQNQKQTIIPLNALVESNGKKGFVYVIDANNIAHKKEVRIAYLWGDKVVINKGLEDEKQIVTVGSPYLSEGQKIIIQK